MPTVKTKDGIEIYYKDWGKGQPIVFSHGWPLSADDWDAQMLFFLSHGYRVIAHDRRGHGRSTQTEDGKIVGVVIEVVTIEHLTGAAVAAAIVGNHAIALLEDEQHLVIPIVARQRPAVAEHDGLTLAPVLVEDFDAVFCLDGAHGRLGVQFRGEGR